MSNNTTLSLNPQLSNTKDDTKKEIKLSNTKEIIQSTPLDSIFEITKLKSKIIKSTKRY